MAVRIIICVIAGYLIGTISTGYIIGKVRNLDIRNYGSGNAGTTNAFRVMGKKAGILTFIGDFLKSFVPLMLMKYWIFKDLDYCALLILIFGFACVMGHNYPVWLHFKGGKGIAASAGVFVVFDHWLFFPMFILFGGTILITKYVSVGSLFLAILYPVWIAIRWRDNPYFLPIFIIACLFTVSAFYRHKGNLVRLANGTENKVGQHVDVGTDNDGKNNM